MILRKVFEKSEEYLEEYRKLDKNSPDFKVKYKELQDRIQTEILELIEKYR